MYKDNQARVLEVTTAHGNFTTPCFMPVATRAVFNNLDPQDAILTNSQIILGGNTYHMLVSPGMEVIHKAGGMHKFMNWHGPMLTDSGGFQVFSLANSNPKNCKIDETGVKICHPETKNIINMTPESSIITQKTIGADIIMAFDQCTPDNISKDETVEIMDRTHRWLNRSIEQHNKQPDSDYGYAQALFGIIQGGVYQDLRLASADYIINQNTDGIAIGGESIGFDMLKTKLIMQWLEPILPKEKVRYAMGVGLNPQDLFDVVRMGVDIFDCVAPTRNARHGALYCGEIVPDLENKWLKFVGTENTEARILIKKQIYRLDERPIMNSCTCYTCKNYSRAYLHFLFKSNQFAYTRLACIHNIAVMQMACDRMRAFMLELNNIN
ncbi:MAG: tRNA guanosine(34) transglycosylase Tgt [Gammaproteobacteria bacterium]|nr:tRNA guanosine(34) transglycosylase Tgt [Gammaproteobacteria bacterium]